MRGRNMAFGLGHKTFAPLLKSSEANWRRVSESVFLKVLEDPKTLGAQAANEGLFPSVKAQVSLEIVLEAEALPAVRADVRSLSRVEALVPSQAFPQGECLFALPARIRLLACVEALVALQDLLALELFAADLAGVSVPVREDALQAPHAVPALFEAAQPASRMDALMGSQIFGRREAFSAGSVRPLRTRQHQEVHELHRTRP